MNIALGSIFNPYKEDNARKSTIPSQLKWCFLLLYTQGKLSDASSFLKLLSSLDGAVSFTSITCHFYCNVGNLCSNYYFVPFLFYFFLLEKLGGENTYAKRFLINKSSTKPYSNFTNRPSPQYLSSQNFLFLSSQ